MPILVQRQYGCSKKMILSLLLFLLFVMLVLLPLLFSMLPFLVLSIDVSQCTIGPTVNQISKKVMVILILKNLGHTDTATTLQ